MPDIECKREMRMQKLNVERKRWGAYRVQLSSPSESTLSRIFIATASASEVSFLARGMLRAEIEA